MHFLTVLSAACVVVGSVEATSSTHNISTPSTEPTFTFGTPTFFGSGCPANTVTVVPSSDGQAVSVLFSQFAARTSSAGVTRDRKSCNLAVPVDVQSVRGTGSTGNLIRNVVSSASVPGRFYRNLSGGLSR
ncbi:hypothetical protein DVH05_003157 [Phytophthora capsici]|nr:hypothetical protein DVH05_003157 [Phytophthora capsici]